MLTSKGAWEEKTTERGEMSQTRVTGPWGGGTLEKEVLVGVHVEWFGVGFGVRNRGPGPIGLPRGRVWACAPASLRGRGCARCVRLWALDVRARACV